MKKDLLKFFVLGGALALGGLAAVAVGDLIAFQPNTPIKSADVNSNFSTLRSAIQALEAPVNTARLADSAVTLSKLSVGGTASDGKVLKLQSGNLVWGDDIVGTPGTTYSAGVGLALSGTAFSVANGGITDVMLADGAVTGAKIAQNGAANGQVLKWNGTAWAPAADTDTNTTYTAGSGMTLSGSNQFAVNTGTIQARVGGNCAVGSSIRQINTDGSVVCETNPRFGGGFSDPGGGSGDCTIGEVRLFAGNFAVRGWAHAAGQTLAININTALFSILGTTYGGNGTTNFVLPDLRGVAPQSANGAPVSYMICLNGIFPARP